MLAKKDPAADGGGRTEGWKPAQSMLEDDSARQQRPAAATEAAFECSGDLMRAVAVGGGKVAVGEKELCGLFQFSSLGALLHPSGSHHAKFEPLPHSKFWGNARTTATGVLLAKKIVFARGAHASHAHF